MVQYLLVLTVLASFINFIVSVFRSPSNSDIMKIVEIASSMNSKTSTLLSELREVRGVALVSARKLDTMIAQLKDIHNNIPDASGINESIKESLSAQIKSLQEELDKLEKRERNS